jgi:predicted DCC family thiol-disulfide oxidoreductase YuxK
VLQEHSADSASADYPTVFFDGFCGLCNHSVNWLLTRDPEHKLRFAPLQGSTAEQKLDAEIRNRLDTLVFLRAGDTFTRTAAVSRILMTLGGRWRLLGGLLWIVPSPIRDLGYRIVSRLRYRLFGKHESCRLPTPQERAVFLD